MAGTVDSIAQASNGVNLQDFMKLLLTQLTYQDPLKPMDNTEFLAQLAQFTNLQQTQQVNQNISQLLVTQASMQSIALLSRTVDFVNGATSQTGQVTAVRFQDNQPVLSISVTSGGNTSVVDGVSLSQVTAIH